MDRLTIGLDIDGVIADFYQHMCNKFEQPVQKEVDWAVQWIFDRFHLIAKDEEFWKTIPVLNFPRCLNFEFDFYVTSLPEEMLSARIEWLKINGFPEKPVVVSHNKRATCLELDINVLIDDKPDTIVSLHGTNVTGIQYQPYYMRYSPVTLFYTRNLRHVPYILKQIEAYALMKPEVIQNV